MAHTSAPWNPSSAFAAFQPDDSVRISLEDYDHAAKCVNAHEAMLVALKLTADNLRHLPTFGQQGIVFEPYTVWLRIVEQAIAHAERA